VLSEIDKQQILNVQLNQSISLDDFVAAGNQQLLHSLHELVTSSESKFIYIWGEQGTGKTHLLHGVCHLASRESISIAYVPMSLSDISIEYLNSLEDVVVICIDDIHLIADKPEWEQAYFHLYNLIRERGHRLLVSANAPPRNLGIALEDLRSRLAWGLVYQVQALDDQTKIIALQQKSRSRGFDLPDNVAQYLINHCPRDSHSLFSIVDKLDKASIAAQRKITIPFVKELL